MPVLANPKYERFAQELAKGEQPEDAYEAAGYTPHRQNAHRLMTNDDIRRRVTELQEALAARVVKRVAYTREWILEQLAENSQQAKEAGKFDASNTALKLIGSELHSMFVAKVEQGAPGDFARMDDIELEAEIARLSGGAVKGLTAETKVAGRG